MPSSSTPSSTTRGSSPPLPRSSPVPSESGANTGDKRRAPDSHDDSDNEENIYRKRQKKPNDEKLHNQWGRTLARLFDAYTDPRTIITTGTKFELAKDAGRDPNTEFSKEQRAQNVSFELLVRHIPALDKYLEEASDAKIILLYRHMKVGQDGARSDDTSELKKTIIDILQDTDSVAAKGLKSNIKSTRGFNHDLTGRLLCPAGVDFEDPDIRKALQSGEYKISPTSWPTFFFEDFKYNAQDQFEGLLRGEILVKCYKSIFLGRSAWDKTDGSSRSTRAPKAVLADMDRVTARSIAYIAAFVYFALSSRENNQKVGGAFDLSALYWQIIRLLEDEDLKEEREELLLWWNKRIFPAKSAAKSVDDAEEDPIAKLKAQRAAKKAAAALRDSTNQ